MPNRKIAPPIIDAVDFKVVLPPCRKYILDNGVQVYAVDMGEQDTLMVNWTFFAGNSYEDKNLIAVAANQLLKNGTATKTAFEINEYFEYYGAYLSRHCHNEVSDVILHCLGKHVSKLLPVVAELITEAVFPSEELEIFKKNMQQHLEVNLRKSEFVAGRLIDAYLFGKNHPYGKYSAISDYQEIHKPEVEAFYKQYYASGKCVIFVAGKLPADIIEQLNENFGKLALQSHTTISKTTTHQIIPAEQKKYDIVNDPDGVQGSIRIARNFPNRHHPEFQKMSMLNNVFGGFFGSRLMTNIREDKGYTYGIYSYLMNHMQESALVISTEAGKEVCQVTIKEIYNEMERLREELIDDEELQTTRNYLIGTILGDLDGPFHVANRWKNIVLNDLTEEYFYNGLDVLRTIEAEELRELAQKYLNPSDFYELLVV